MADDQTAEQLIRAVFAVAEALNDPDSRDLRRAPRHTVNVPVWIYVMAPMEIRFTPRPVP